MINSQEKLLNFKSFECVEFETLRTTKSYKYMSDSIFQVKSLLLILLCVALKYSKYRTNLNKEGNEYDFKLYRNPII